MVEVKCSGCGADYKIEERRIPPSGLKMRCPKCGTSVLVNKPGAEPPPPPPPPQGGAPPGGGFGEVDLPAPAAPRPPGPPAAPRPPPPPAAAAAGGFGFGEIDLAVDIPSAGDDFGVTDLPASPGQATGGAGSDYGEVDLPAVAAPPPPPPPPAAPAPPRPPAPPAPGGFGEVDLPAPAAPRSPSPNLGGFAGRTPGGFGEIDAGSDLPKRADAKPGGGGFDLPAPARGGVDLPTTGGAGLPQAGGVDLPLPGSAGLPAAGHAGLPATGNAGLPLPGESSLPLPGQTNLPSHANNLPSHASNLPSTANALPSAASSLPSAASNLPSAVGAGLPQSAQNEGFPERSGAGLPGAIVGAELYGDDPPGAGGADFGNIDAGDVDAGGLDLDTGASPQKKPAAGAALDSPDLGGLVELQPKKSGTAKYVAVGVLLFAIAGGALALVPSVGPFGFYLVSDLVNAGAHDDALTALEKSADEELAEDTAKAANQVFQQGKQAVANAPRHERTVAFAAYLVFAKSLRFGANAGDEAYAKQLLTKLEGAESTPELQLAQAAKDAATGQVARARQTASRLAGNNIHAAVLAGEIELAAKEPEQALAAWEKAVEMSEDARTMFGLARAQAATGNLADAEKTAKKVLEASPNHVSARTLIASIAAKDLSRDDEAIALLKKVTEDEDVRANASEAELVDAYTQIGMLHLSQTRMSDAERAFGEALKLAPQAVDALVGNGELFYQSERFSEAQGRFEAASRADANSIVAKVGVAKTWIALERLREAKEVLSKLQTAHPKNTLIAHWLGKAEESLGNKDDAEAAYRKAIEVGGDDPQVVQSYVALSQLLSSLGRTDEAEAKLAAASEKFPKLAALHKAKGEVEMRTGDYENAIDEFDQALLIKDDLETLYLRGSALRRARRFDEAAAAFDQVAGIDPEFPGLAMERGLYYEDTGQGEKALAMYSDALKKAPDDIDLKLRVGSSQVISGHVKEAEPLLSEVLQARPNSAEANHFYGRALLLSGKSLDRAKRHLETAAELSPSRATYHLYVGWVANEVGQRNQAEQALDKALALDANLGDAYWQRAVLLQKQGATLDALEDLKIALEKRPSRYEAYATMALCYQDQNKWAEAEDAWKRAVAADPERADWRYRLGKIYVKQRRDNEAAVRELRKAVELGEAVEIRPAWLYDAHFLLAESLKAENETEDAIKHYKRFLEIAPTDYAYRLDAERALESLGVKIRN